MVAAQAPSSIEEVVVGVASSEGLVSRNRSVSPNSDAALRGLADALIGSDRRRPRCAVSAPMPQAGADCVTQIFKRRIPNVRLLRRQPDHLVLGREA